MKLPSLVAIARLLLVASLAVCTAGALTGCTPSSECVFDKDCDDDELCEDGACVDEDDADDDDGGNEGEGENEGAEGEGEGAEGEGEGEGNAGPARAPGSACDCDDDCQGSSDGHAGVCVLGVCMQEPSGACSAGGSRAECAEGFQCWGLEGSDGFCWPDCDAFTCEGACDADGSCAPTADTSCTESCSAFCGGGGGEGEGECPPNSTLEDDGFCYCLPGFIVVDNACVHECESDAECEGGDVCIDNSCRAPPCTATSCGEGLVCGSSGVCIQDIGSPPPGPVPTCSSSVVPSFTCTGGEANCGAVVAFEPDEGPGYWDYPLNGETTSNEYRSFIRRDVMMLIKYAAAATECLSANWAFGNGEPLGLGDMSEANGAIPGTSDGSPGHPPGTHEDGRDMDIAYFQLTAPDNRLRAVCEHTSGGQDQYHCVQEPDDLDVWRTALFIAKMHDSVQLRVIGVDGKAGPLIESAIEQLCDAGYLNGSAACNGGLALAYETVDEGLGWFHFHHHHVHISLLSRPEAGLASFAMPPRGTGAWTCLDEGCHTIVDAAHDPRRRLDGIYGMSRLNAR